MTDSETDWKIFIGDGRQHENLKHLPAPPPWRFSRPPNPLALPQGIDVNREAHRAEPFIPNVEMVIAVNAALYLRRPLLITGKPGTGKSTLIAKVAHELKLGPVIRWPITSRSTVREGMYEYDAVGRLQASKHGEPPVESYLKLGPLGTALLAESWPRPLLIDEIDKSDLDFANDLLNVIEEGEYEIPELRRLKDPKATVRNFFGEEVEIQGGRIVCGQFPFVVMTSNAEREFPPPFLRRCVRLNIQQPTPKELANIVRSHLAQYPKALASEEVSELIDKFDLRRKDNQEVSTDQLLNAVFLTVAMREQAERSFSKEELDALQENLLRQLTGSMA
jgi:MoxR-like ATPase